MAKKKPVKKKTAPKKKAAAPKPKPKPKKRAAKKKVQSTLNAGTVKLLDDSDEGGGGPG